MLRSPKPLKMCLVHQVAGKAQVNDGKITTDKKLQKPGTIWAFHPSIS
ncbi:MAG: hypothetical protein IPI77_17195 [Saprospiraceae bacterium]|nr:hypothetical protein [Saprospiraceae bacterium]